MENGLWESGAIGFLCFVSTIGWRGCMDLRDFFFFNLRILLIIF